MNKLKKCRHGDMVYQPNDRYIGRSFDLYGEFSEGEVALFRRLVKPGDTAVDVGANIGAHTVALARLVGPSGRVVALEPQRLAYYCLCANVALNNLHHVVCHQAAAGAAAGMLVVPDLDPQAEQNFGGLELSALPPGGQGQVVPVRPIDDLQLPACHLLKIDVEGMERQVLAGAAQTIRRYRPFLYVEDDRPERSADLRASLDALGYVLYLHRPPYFNPDNFCHNPTNVFGNTVSLNLYGHPREAASPIDPREFGIVKVAAATARGGGPSAATSSGVLAEAMRRHRAGDPGQAVPLYRQAVREDPANAQAWYLLGAACQALGEADEAAAALREALRRQPQLAEAHKHLGVVLAQQGRMEEAEASFRSALRFRPDDAETHTNLGLALRQQGRLPEAADCFREALRLRPDSARAQDNLRQVLRDQGATAGSGAAGAPDRRGLALLEEGRWEEAADHFRRALLINPDLAAAHNQLGLCCWQLRRYAEAEACYRQALRLAPNVAEVHNNLAVSLKDQGKLEEALESLRQALRLNPELAQAHGNLGIVLCRLGRYDEAEASCRQALRLRPDFPEAFNNLGNLFRAQGRFEEAQAAYGEAIRLRPAYAAARSNQGIVLLDQGRFEEALAACDEAIRLEPAPAASPGSPADVSAGTSESGEAPAAGEVGVPRRLDDANPYWNRALIWLLQGDFARGWLEYEWRWRLKEFDRRSFQRPAWDGSALAGRTILLHAEQGLGDTIQFVRYAPLVKQRGGTVVLECQRPLARLLAGCPGVDRLVARGDPLPEFDVHAPLLSLPRLLGTTLHTIPAPVPYLRADPALVRRWRRQLGDGPGLKIGIAWQGNPGFPGDRSRSVPLTRFAPVAAVPGVRLISLQKGPGSEQLRSAPFFVQELPGLDEEAGPFRDTAAVMACLDLVVTTDTALPHLAGALGVPCWLALSFVPDWRWLLERADSPWYPSLRLFRQPRPGDWDPVFAEIALELGRAASGAGGRGLELEARRAPGE